MRFTVIKSGKALSEIHPVRNTKYQHEHVYVRDFGVTTLQLPTRTSFGEHNTYNAYAFADRQTGSDHISAVERPSVGGPDRRNRIYYGRRGPFRLINNKTERRFTGIGLVIRGPERISNRTIVTIRNDPWRVLRRFCTLRDRSKMSSG